MSESRKIYETVKTEVGKAIIGYEDVIEDFLICLSSGGHILLEGVPGVAKTTLAKTISAVTGLTFSRIQFTQDLLPSDITGHYYYNQKVQEFQFRKGPIFANVVLADEINRAPSKTQSALLEAMEEKQVTVEGNTFKLREPFLVIATINPVELEGVYSLPEAQLDRFMIKGKMDYLQTGDELRMLALKNKGWKDSQVKSLGIPIFETMRSEIRGCHADGSILRYIRDIIASSRDDNLIVLGASPRAGEQLLYASKAHAIIMGRNYVVPDDVKRSARKVLPHRLTLSLDSELEGTTPSAVIENILSRVEVVRNPQARSGIAAAKPAATE
ncbi:MAG: AAA family ATPase [Thermoplasmatota archaeon]